MWYALETWLNTVCKSTLLRTVTYWPGWADAATVVCYLRAWTELARGSKHSRRHSTRNCSEVSCVSCKNSMCVVLSYLWFLSLILCSRSDIVISDVLIISTYLLILLTYLFIYWCTNESRYLILCIVVSEMSKFSTILWPSVLLGFWLSWLR